MKRFFVVATVFMMMTGLSPLTGRPGHAEEKKVSGTDAPATAPEEKKAAADEPGGAMEEPSLRLKVPFTSPQFDDVPVAKVNEDSVTLGELRDAVKSIHEGMPAEKATHARKDFSEPLNRLINIKLILQEAGRMELDQQEDIKELENAFNAKLLRQILFKNQVQEVKPDDKEVERIYKEMTREWKVNALVFKNVDQAKKFVEEVKSGKNFQELMDKAIKDGVAEKAREEIYMKNQGIDPRVSDSISKLKIGGVSPVINLDNNNLVFKLEEMRYVDNPEIRKKADYQAGVNARLKALEDFKKDLYKKYVKKDDKLIKKLDFEAKRPGFENLLKDKRVLVTVKGERTVTVSDLAQAVKDKFFHGVDIAIKSKKVNKAKPELLDDMVSKAVFRKAALEANIHNSKEYRDQTREYKNSLVFGAFVEKVIVPDIKITSEDQKAYYDKHLKEYNYPGMVQVEEIIFKSKDDAQSAIDKLRQGMDFKWLKNNADGQVEKGTPNLPTFAGGLITMDSLPEEARKLLTGAPEGDYRLYTSPQGFNYVMHILKVVPSRTATMDEMRSKIAEELYNEKLNSAVQDWSKKLRDAGDIRIYIDSGK
jgi:hypothetical protein